ncbi:hypothetical protein CSKR_113155 [Clonorchis sinensis]|uniref:Uncharacterized protein n=1 Tax=Clonorchis sinensis TaxID=79923 RepID=A0A8T1MYI8_CLOSI|nr:hypothetical protein CSKR_113155 [Clonorchis sinensis]
MMSSRLVMKRLQSNCQARRTDQQSINAPELPLFHNIADTYILFEKTLNGKNETEKEADTLECRWRCANCTYTWLSISRVRSTQVLDQTTAPSISNNLHFYRLTWLSGPTDLEGFFEPISMSPVAVRSGSLSVSSDAMDEWCREMRFRGITWKLYGLQMRRD